MFGHGAQDVRDAAKIMRTTGFRRLPVLDEQEQVVGLLSVDDLCGNMSDRIRRIIGKIEWTEGEANPRYRHIAGLPAGIGLST
ncbi:MAG: CBS domain-containing protein [Acetobacteraceae bacterium]|nr:CBS domain-containing protein [Acetobacteraceae bacterium]